MLNHNASFVLYKLSRRRKSKTGVEEQWTEISKNWDEASEIPTTKIKISQNKVIWNMYVYLYNEIYDYLGLSTAKPGPAVSRDDFVETIIVERPRCLAKTSTFFIFFLRARHAAPCVLRSILEEHLSEHGNADQNQDIVLILKVSSFLPTRSATYFLV